MNDSEIVNTSPNALRDKFTQATSVFVAKDGQLKANTLEGRMSDIQARVIKNITREFFATTPVVSSPDDLPPGNIRALIVDGTGDKNKVIALAKALGLRNGKLELPAATPETPRIGPFMALSADIEFSLGVTTLGKLQEAANKKARFMDESENLNHLQHLKGKSEELDTIIQQEQTAFDAAYKGYDPDNLLSFSFKEPS